MVRPPQGGACPHISPGAVSFVVAERKRVWILGAGFSRPLGGPLINDLLAFRERQLIAASLPESANAETVLDSLRVRAFCAYGQASGYWQHAEDFLATVDAALSDENDSAERHMRGESSARCSRARCGFPSAN